MMLSADAGSCRNAAPLILRKSHLSHMFATGDISYAQGFTYGWDQYWENVEPLYTQIPLATTIGCATWYFVIFRPPSPGRVYSR